MKRLTFITIVLACLAAPLSARAQSTNGSVGGTVSDASGALIPGVTVTITNVGTGIANQTLTNETGSYQFVNLQAGAYNLSAELPGFQTARYNSVQLGGSQQLRLNFQLQVGDVATRVDVTVAADPLLAATATSIGSVLVENQLRELPVGDRNVLVLLAGMAGTGPTEGQLQGNFGGQRLDAVNITRDGVVMTAGRYNQGTFATTYTSSDLVEEVRVTTATVDAEAMRGSGQVQMVTRSGTNEFRGSAVWTNRNSKLDASNWFNNFNGVHANWTNRNQFAARLGGPIRRDKTFFFFLIDEQRYVRKENFVGTVLTNEARQGVYRFFPGADSRNALQINPTVDRLGNPIRPAGATGDLRSINLFSFDSQRSGYDPTGYVQKVLLARMPQPNDWTVGDGLNTAGIRFTRRIPGEGASDGQSYDTDNRDQFNLRIDHNFNSSNRVSFIYTYERTRNVSAQAGIAQWPNGYNGANWKDPRLYTVTLGSTITPNLINDFRVGFRGHRIQSFAPWFVGRQDNIGEITDPKAKEAYGLLPQSNGLALQLATTTFPQNFMNLSGGGNAAGQTRGSWDPLLSFGDTLSWIHGRHSFKMGLEHRHDRTQGWNQNNFMPYVQFGAGFVTAPIDTTTVAGLTTTNAGLARNILYDLAGSIGQVQQGFDLTSAKPPLQFKGIQDGVTRKLRDWRANELSTFFKDEWKVTSNLTLNLGVKWEYYGVPYEANGIAGRVVGAERRKGLCGYTCGGPVTVELVGKNSPNPGMKLYNDDWNNFAPVVGFSYSLHGLGRSTILRGGYGISYAGRAIAGAMGADGLDLGAGQLPGLSAVRALTGLIYSKNGYWSLANLSEVPFASQFAPLQTVPLTDTRELTMNVYHPNRRTPYIQNFTLSLQRELAKDVILQVAYVGSKSTALYSRLPLNSVNIRNNQFLEAFNVTRAGGDHPLFDRMLMGLTIPGAGRVDGTTLTGSSALRRYTNTRTLIANGSVGGLADFLNRSTNVTGAGGGFLRNGGFPEDFLVGYPQFLEMGLNSNAESSNYHSLELQFTKRLSHGITNQSSYTWSKTLGTASGGTTRDPNSRSLDKGVLSFHRTHIITSNGTYALPFGENQAFLSEVPRWVNQLVKQWQLGGLFRWSSGAPLTLTAGSLSNLTQTANNTPLILGELPEGRVIRHNDGRLPTFWEGLTQVTTDPGRLAVVTSRDALNTAGSTRAIVDAQGRPVLMNPAPGDVGSLGLGRIEGLSRLQLDMNLLKHVRVDEKRDLEIRADVVNLLNHPIFNNPIVDINSPNFGQIQSAEDGRRFTLSLRLNF